MAKQTITPLSALQQFNELKDRINHKIAVFCEKHANPEALTTAWQQFIGNSEYAPPVANNKIPEANHMFIIWRNYHWYSQVSLDKNHQLDNELNNPASWYLSRHPVSLTERDFIQAASQSYFSYYRVTSIVEDQSMVLEDLLTGETITVIETIAAKTASVGGVILTSVVAFQDHHFLLGTASFLFEQFPNSNVSEFCCEPDMFEAEDEMFYWLRGQELALFELYWDLRDQLVDPFDLNTLH